MRLPHMSGKDVLKALRLGLQEISRRGSKLKMEHQDGQRIVFPFHK